MPYALPVACCASDALCTECRASSLAALRDVAAARGRQWTVDLASRGVTGAWPVGSAIVLAVATIKVRDLAADARVVEELARLCEEEAARQWRT